MINSIEIRKVLLLSFLCLTMVHYAGAQVIEDPVRFLALGDSYTIGQNVSVEDRWPEQLADTLAILGYEIDELRIEARTGWTTGDLIADLEFDPPDSNYTLASLLIGVNNQFQGRSIDEYRVHFTSLLERAIAHTGDQIDRVFVLSIPDYMFTPFGQNREGVSEEIDLFNAVNAEISDQYGVAYIPITDISRRGLDEPELVAGDGLHPSGIMYGEWVDRIIANAQLEDVGTSTARPTQQLIKIYPNPVLTDLNIELNNTSVIRLSDGIGNILFEEKQQGIVQLPMEGMPAGIYFLNVIDQNGSCSKTIIKN